MGEHNRPEWLRQQQAQRAEIVDLELEVVVPVSDADRAHRCYKTLGCRLDIDHAASEDFPERRRTPDRVESNSKDSILNTALVQLQYPTGQGAETAVEFAINPALSREAFAADLPAEQT